MRTTTLKSLVSRKLVRNLILLCGLTFFAFYSGASRAALRFLIGETCDNYTIDASYPGAVCSVYGYCYPEDTEPVAAAFAWGTCDNGVPVVNHSKSFGTIGGMALQVQATNKTIYLVEIGHTYDTAFCNGFSNTEHASNPAGCNELSPPPGLPPDVCYVPDMCPGSCQDPPPIYPCDSFLPDTNCPYYIDRNPCMASPVLVDVAGNGFDLTGAADGVDFDIDGNPDGVKERIAWTRAGSDDAWLFFDRNLNGKVDSGRELFGNFTAQEVAQNPPNGFNALARFDLADRGGNGDGIIDKQDRVFSYLRLWQDVNHNGSSEPSELHTLSELGIAKLELDYKESKRTDQYGNQFRYRTKVRDAKGEQVGRWAWDVFLVSQ